MVMTDPGASTLIARYLPAEPVVWAGRPNPARVGLIASLILLFAIPWTVFALSWQTGVLAILFYGEGTGTPDGVRYFMLPVFALFGLPFVVVGLGMCAQPFIAVWRARRTLFAVTRRRLVVLRPKLRGGIELESYAPADIHAIRLSTRSDGSGDLLVTVGWTRDSDGDRLKKQVEMRGVRDAQRAQQALETLRASVPREA